MRTPAQRDVPALKLHRVSRVVDGEPHLSEIDLELAPGSFNVVLGRTRAGKTSLLRVLAGLDHPSQGRLLLGTGEQDITRRSVRERGVAMVYQQFVNYPSLTVYDNIASPLRLQKAPRHPQTEIDRRVREAAELLGLTPFLMRLPAELSGGQQQRTAIARALVKDANLVLLDEPLANLDYKLREELRVQLRAIFAARGATVVYATAEPDEALLLGGRTAVIHEGRLLQVGSTLSVYEQPNCQVVAEVFSDPQLNLFDLEVAQQAGTKAIQIGHADHMIQVGTASTHALQSLPTGRYRVGVRAHHLRLAPSSEADLRLRASTLIDEVTGSATLLHMAFGSVTLTAQLPGIHRRALGSIVELFIAPERLIVFHQDGRPVAFAPSSSTISRSSDAAHGP
ncbi:MAG: hypothetical protein RL701_7362, partial [Pseudomonadota bacterium]